MKNSIKEFRDMEAKVLLEQAHKKRVQIIDEVSKLANQGKKNSLATKKLRKEIAQIETVINEKIIESMKEI
jgi:ribosomal protein L29